MTYVERIEKEAQELKNKLDSLNNFLDSNDSKKLNPVQIVNLKLQAHYMKAYHEILLQRIHYDLHIVTQQTFK